MDFVWYVHVFIRSINAKTILVSEWFIASNKTHDQHFACHVAKPGRSRHAIRPYRFKSILQSKRGLYCENVCDFVLTSCLPSLSEKFWWSITSLRNAYTFLKGRVVECRSLGWCPCPNTFENSTLANTTGSCLSFRNVIIGIYSVENLSEKCRCNDFPHRRAKE